MNAKNTEILSDGEDVLKLQVLYSLDMGQLAANFPLSDWMLVTRDSLISFAETALLGRYCFLPDNWGEVAYKTANKAGATHIPEGFKKIPTIVKLSLCIIVPKGQTYNSPDWYNECRGKIWWDDLHPNIPFPY